MIKRHICKTCKTGEDLYSLDPDSIVCPYIYYLQRNRCEKYENRSVWIIKEKIKALKKHIGFTKN